MSPSGASAVSGDRTGASVRIGVLLAGGESRRMGRDKRSLVLEGRTLVERNLEVLRARFPIVAVALRSTQRLEPPPPPEVEVIRDEPPESPLAGIATALERYSEPVFVLAADLISPRPAAIERVLTAFTDVDVALPEVGRHVEPLHAVYGPRCLPVMRDLLARNEHSILEVFPAVRTAVIPFDSEEPFFNVNTREDWAAAKRRFDEGG